MQKASLVGWDTTWLKRIPLTSEWIHIVTGRPGRWQLFSNEEEGRKFLRRCSTRQRCWFGEPPWESSGCHGYEQPLPWLPATPRHTVAVLCWPTPNISSPLRIAMKLFRTKTGDVYRSFSPSLSLSSLFITTAASFSAWWRKDIFLERAKGIL